MSEFVEDLIFGLIRFLTLIILLLLVGFLMYGVVGGADGFVLKSECDRLSNYGFVTNFIAFKLFSDAGPSCRVLSDGGLWISSYDFDVSAVMSFKEVVEDE